MPAPGSPSKCMPFILVSHSRALRISQALLYILYTIIRFDPNSINLKYELVLPPLQMRKLGTREIR